MQFYFEEEQCGASECPLLNDDCCRMQWIAPVDVENDAKTH